MSTTASSAADGRLILRVLDGAQKGAEAPMRHQRLLVGNLLSECDVVLDVGRAQQHACLVRASSDGWTVLSITGDLWVEGDHLAAQEVRGIASGAVMTLGEVSFCIADSGTVDWDQVHVPARKAASGATVPAAHAYRRAAAAGKPPVAKASAGRFAIGRRAVGVVLSMAVLALSGLGISLFAAPSLDGKAAVASPSLAEAGSAVIGRFPWASEVTLQADPQRPRRVLLGGYLPQRQQSTTLESALRAQGIEAEHRWVAVDELSADLARRLGLQDDASGDRLRYDGQGRFGVLAVGEQFEVLHRLIQRALQDMPALHALELRLSDRPGRSADPGNGDTDLAHASGRMGLPIVVRYARADGAPGGVAVAGLEQLRPAQKLQRLEVLELRMGKLPSIVLDNGARYFEGSSLPGGAVLVDVRPGHLSVRVGDDTRRIELTDAEKAGAPP